MSASTNQLIAAVLSGPVLLEGFKALWKRLRRDPKGNAEARKINADASHTEWGTLRDEIHRLQSRVEEQDRRIAELEKLDCERVDREVELKRENGRLRQKVSKLESRVEGLEAIFRVGPVPPEMQAQLDALDRKTGRRS